MIGMLVDEDPAAGGQFLKPQKSLPPPGPFLPLQPGMVYYKIPAAGISRLRLDTRAGETAPGQEARIRWFGGRGLFQLIPASLIQVRILARGRRRRFDGAGEF